MACRGIGYASKIPHDRPIGGFEVEVRHESGEHDLCAQNPINVVQGVAGRERAMWYLLISICANLNPLHSRG